MSEDVCLVCDRSAEVVPLLQLKYQDKSYWICPQHLPILIHKPSQLVDKLPGVDQLNPVGHDH